MKKFVGHSHLSKAILYMQEALNGDDEGTMYVENTLNKSIKEIERFSVNNLKFV